MHIVSFIFQTIILYGPKTELKGKMGIRENISLVFYHIKTVGA